MEAKYNIMKQNFNTKECELLTTIDEYINNKMKTIDKYLVKAKCGHIHLVYYHMFLLRESGIICKECLAKTKSIENKNINFNLSETFGINILKKFIKNKFELKIMDEGTSADIAIKPKNIKKDLYLPIQIKTTEKFNYNCYSFGINNQKYKDMLLILICLNEEKIWIINDVENINLKAKLNITKKSKYEKYFITNNLLLNNILLDYYNNFNYNKTYDEINTAITKCVQIEQFYKKLRETNLSSYIKFIYDDLKYQVYDFKINNYKIQEKTITFDKKKNKVTLSKSAKKNKSQPYELNDNDYYWLHCRNNQEFYVIPEKILFEYGFIADKTNNIKGNKYLNINGKNNIWLEEYKFSYDNIGIFKNKYSELFIKKKIKKTEYNYIKNDNITSSKNFISKKEAIHKTFKELPYYKYYYICIQCNSFMQKSDNCICVKCYNEKRANYDKLPTLEQLEHDTKTINFTQTGKKYGVSDNTIRKWIKKLRKKKELSVPPGTAPGYRN
jgi:hypothetical protein